MTRQPTTSALHPVRRPRLGLERLEDRAVPAYTATLVGTIATFTGDGASDALTFDATGGLLRHNRAGDPGFNSDLDFDTVVAGDQTLAAAGVTTRVNVNAGGGDDTLTVGTPAIPASAASALFVFDGEAGTDTAVFENSADVGRTINVRGAPFRDVFIPSTVNLSSNAGSGAEVVTVRAGTGNDTINVTDAPQTGVSVFAGDGDDTIAFADGATLGGEVNGGFGTDTLDYSAYTTPVAVNLGANAPNLVATLGADQGVPPTASTATGTATVAYDTVAHTFDITVTVDGIAPADVTGFHIHRGAFGVNGPIISDFVPGGVPIAPLTPTVTGFTFTATGLALDPLHEAALLGGVTYVNVHTAANPGGAIRGQLVAAAPFVTVSGTATGTDSVFNVENATGGSGSFAVGTATFGDSLVGNIDVNVLKGGAGNDVLVGVQGNDTMQGEADDDILIWSNGDNNDVMDGGAGVDRVQVNGALGKGDVFTVGAAAFGRVSFQRTNLVPFALDIGTTETLTAVGYSGDDTFAVAKLAGVADLTAVNLAGLDGNDTFTFADGATLLGGTLAGGTGTDTVDYSAYTTPIAVNLGANSPTLVASLDASQEVPPTASTATGAATITYDNAAHTFDIAVTVDGIAPADVTGFHIHRGPIGVSGPIIEDFGTAALVATATGFTFNATGIPFDPLHEAALLGGVTYLNVHTAANPAGAIRGQIVASAPLVAAPGTATGTAGVVGVENVTGGSGKFTVGTTEFGDGLVGTKLANMLTGGAGNDVIVGTQGDDAMQGEDGDDILIWSNGDNNDVMDGGAGADTVQVNGAVGAGDVFTVAANGTRLDFDRANLVPFSLDIGTTETLAVNAVGGNDVITVDDLTGVVGLGALRLFGQQGDDVIDATAQASAAVAITLAGGADNDTLLGSPQADVLLGGPGTDAAVGNKGPDQFLGGAGDDTFVWNNGDGSDLIDGEAGADTVQVNGAPAGDAFVVAPNGARVRFDRTNLIPFTLDVGTSETLTVNGGDGADAFAVTPLADTKVEVNGGPPTIAPGDALGVNLGGATDTIVPLPGTSDGQFTFGNRAPIVFTGLESVTPTLGVGQDTVSRFAVGAGAGGSSQVTVFNPDQSAAFTLDAFPGFTGGVRVAAADLNGDGTADLVVGTGPGGPTQVRVIDGKTKAELFSVQPFEATFTGGVYVAAGDVTGDGKADLIIAPDEGGGPRVRVFSGDGFGQIADFFGIDDPAFRGGARAAAGDVNGDGIADLLVAAGFGGGPRIAVFDGTSLAGTPVKLFGDFFVFENTLRNGVFIGAGDLNGDGFADVIAGGGPGGGPRVFALSGKDLLTGTQTQVANFFAGDVTNRGGIRLTAKDLDGDDKADLVVGAGTGAGSRVTGYLGSTIPADGTPPEQFAFDAFPGFTGGVYVG
ncbi:MAG TPA: CHRD domain-containing protein [Fimbriiglobus sp.]|nr:CHRD domain-containing protein [Fimbriiglobus sp.]